MTDQNAVFDSMKRFVDETVGSPPALVVVGDVVLERVLRCRPDVWMREHAEQTCYEILRSEGDRTSLGGGGVCCSLWKSLGGEAAIMSYVGRDDAGKRIRLLLTEKQIQHDLVELADEPTPFCLRVIKENRDPDRFERDVLCRNCVEPATLGGNAERAAVAAADRLHSMIQGAGALLLYDGGMGFLSRAVVSAVAAVVADEQARRAAKGSPALTIGVMPRGDWSRFRALPADILVATEKQWLCALGRDVVPELKQDELARAAYVKLGHLARNLVITRGPSGSIILDGVEGRFFALASVGPMRRGPDFVGIRAAEAFATVFLLARLRHPGADELLPGAALASFAGAKQHQAETGTTVGRDAFADSAEVLETIGRALPEKPAWDTALTGRQQLALAVVSSLGTKVDLRSAFYRSKEGRESRIVAGPKYRELLDRIGEALRPGRFLMICGESRCGKSYIIKHLDVFWPGYKFEDDRHTASRVLQSDETLAAAIERAGEAKACLVLDEIRSAGKAGLEVLLNRVDKADYGGPCPIVCAGHYDDSIREMKDLRNRAQEGFFLIPPLREDDRVSDIPLLACAQVCEQFRTKVNYISARAMFQLAAYEYCWNSDLENIAVLRTLLEESCKQVPPTKQVLTPEQLCFTAVDPAWEKHALPARVPPEDYPIEVICA